MRTLALLMIGLLLPAGLFASTPRPASSLTPAFVENVGQARYVDGAPASHVDALVARGRATAYLHAGGMHVVHAYSWIQPDGSKATDLYRVDISLLGANASARHELSDPADGYERHLLIGTGAQGVIAQRYKALTYREVYPGIDMRVTLTPSGPKVDYIVHPGADPSQIAVAYRGTTSLEINDAGGLTAVTPVTTMQERAPVAWTQSPDGRGRRPVSVAFSLIGTAIRFTIDDYDHSQVLVIDPDLVWATYYGGNGGFTDPQVAFDPTGDLYTAGSTIARDLPRTIGVFQNRANLRQEGYIAKFSYDGRHLWHTYVGGTGTDYVYDLAVDTNGDAWICGSLDSNEHPLVDLDRNGSGPYGGLEGDTIIKRAGYAMRVTADGAWGDSWIVDGREDDEVRGIAFANNRLALIGSTRSPRVNDVSGTPYTKNPANNTRQYDMFISRLILRPNSTDRWTSEWLTYYGGSLDDHGRGVAINAAGDVIGMGYSQSDDVPVTNGSAYRGVADIIVMKFVTTAPFTPGRAWALYHGTSDNDFATGIAIDLQGNAVVAGWTNGNDMPTVGAYQATLNGPTDGFLWKFSGANGQTIYSSYFGGSATDLINALALDRSGRIYIGGMTSMSDDLPITNNAHQADPFDDPDWQLADGWYATFSPTAANVLYCTYYGAPPQPNLPAFPPSEDNPPPPDTDFGFDEITGIAVDGDAYVATVSSVASLLFETTEGAFQDGSGLNADTVQYVSHVSYWTNCPDSTIDIIVDGPTALCPGDERLLVAPNGFARYLWNTGDTVRSIITGAEGEYWVICTDAGGCRFRDTVELTISPIPTVSAGNDTSGCLNEAIMLTATPSSGLPPYSYKWRRLEPGPAYIDDDTLRQPSVNPATTSRYEVTLTDSAGCEARDTVVVTVIDPKPTVAPSPLDFGTLDACENARIDSVVVTNPMSYAITIDGLIPDGPRIELVSSVDPPISVPAGESRTVILRVSPSTDGVTTGSAQITGQPCDWTLAVPYRVEKATLLATIRPGTIDFGSAVNCEPIVRDSFSVIRNGGSDPLTILPGTVNGPFTITSPTAETTVAPGDTLRVEFRYEPTADGTFNEIARFPFTSGECNDTLRVTLRGSRGSVWVETSPSTIDIGTLEGCEDERDTTFVIRNRGSVDITATLPASAEVIFDPAGPFVIPAEDSVVVTVTVRPTGSGPFAFDRTITYQPCDEEHTFRVTGSKNGVAFTTPSVVNMGEVNTCTDDPSTTESFQISFDGTGSGTVTSVNVGAQLSSTLTAGVTLASGVPQTFDVTWTPTADGAFIDSIVVVFDPCDIRRVIRIQGVRTTPSLTATQPAINLGALTADATGTIEFENDGTDTLFVGASASMGAIVVAQRPGPLEPLLPGAILEVDYRIVCAETINDTITATTLGECTLEASTVFTGTCQGAPDATATVVIDDVNAEVGDRVSVPMRLTQSSGLDANGLFTWEADITYNPMVVVGTGETPDCFVDGQYAPCTITISGTRTDSIGILAELDLTTVLGNDTQTDLVISRFVWTQDTTVAVTTQDGSVTLTDICEEGGLRLLDPKAEPFSIRVYPQPAATTLTLDIRGLGSEPGTWTLFTYVGQQVDSGALTPDAEGNALVEVDVSSLSSGTYFLTIDARGTIYRMPVLIQR